MREKWIINLKSNTQKRTDFLFLRGKNDYKVKIKNGLNKLNLRRELIWVLIKYS